MNPSDAAILVVDDNGDNRYTLSHRLRRQGYTEIGESHLADDLVASAHLLGAETAPKRIVAIRIGALNCLSPAL